MHRLLIPIIAATLTACTADAAQPEPVCPRSLDDVELFGPVLSDDLAVVLGKCMSTDQHFWLTFADEGPHLSISFAGEATIGAVGCVQSRLLSLGLQVVEADTTGGETTANSSGSSGGTTG